MELVPAAEFYARKFAGVKASDKIAAPMVMSDVSPYRSVIDGSEIGGRRQHREHLKAHGCIEIGNEVPKQRGPVELPPVEADIKRAMQDEGLRAEAKRASRKAKRALV